MQHLVVWTCADLDCELDRLPTEGHRDLFAVPTDGSRDAPKAPQKASGLMALPKHPEVLVDYSALAGYRDHPIHVAQGLLMERHKVTARAALGLLRQQAAARRLSLIEMAQWLLKTHRPR